MIKKILETGKLLILLSVWDIIQEKSSTGEDQNPVRTRILQYLDNPDLNKILLCDAYEIRPFLKLETKPTSAEIVGAGYSACVIQTGLILLGTGIPIRINPALTLGILEITQDVVDDTDYKRNWLEESLKESGFSPKLQREYVLCKPIDS